ncbi:MAG: hypothetical protein IT338_17160 [Thermomicrobiales bacterium]|nr:hypothetical protein [Thermomicrobiales bacterium]
MSYFQPTNGPTELIARRGYGGPTPTGLDGVLDKIGDFIKSGAKAAVSVYSSGQQSAGQAQAYQQIAAQQQAALQQRGGMPGWVVPVAVGGVAVVAGALLLRKRKNPARRRR